MGEVYRARDTKLGRDVAIKVLPDAFLSDSDRLARFELEARVLATLNHPQIGSIYGLEEAEGIRALVLELVEGPTLADRIARGPLPIDETLRIARQIAAALQAAHDRGVIHRDLKPANIKVRPDGTVKVLDFGLAKVLEVHGSDSALSRSPTMLASMPGTLLGTAAYMSPEQARGEDTDRRADVWAFGCVLFEMCGGRAPFDGGTMTEVLANVLKSEPDWRRLPAAAPESIRRVLRRCLQKDAALRLRDIGDAGLEIDEAQLESRSPPPATAPLRRTERLAWAGAVLALAVLSAVAAAWAIGRRAPEPPEVRFDIDTGPVPDLFLLSSVALSPDGRSVLFVGDSNGQASVFQRRLDSVSTKLLAGTAGAAFPFWSPDGRSVGFYADGWLKRLDLDGSLVRKLAQAVVGVGGAWNRDGVMLFVPNPASPISRISAEGGPPVPVTRRLDDQAGHSFPHFLPDGRHFLYYAAGSPASRGIYVGQIDDSASKKLFDSDGGAVYTSGHVLFLRQEKILAQAFDADRLELSGSPFEVADSALGRSAGFALTFSAAANGAVAFRAGNARTGRQFAWFDRSGNLSGNLDELLRDVPMSLSPSPDGSQVVFFQRGETASDVWMLDTRRGVRSRFTDNPAEDIFPVWSRDGSHIFFSSIRNGRLSIYRKPTVGTGGEAVVLTPDSSETFALDTSPDGRWLLFQQANQKTGFDIMALSLRGDAKPEPLVQTDAEEYGGVFSPDGKWLAYISNSSGPSEVYVQAFPGPGPRQQVSPKGGAQIRWRADGRELFYIALDGTLMAVPIRVASDGTSIDPGTPTPLFKTRVGILVNLTAAAYVVSADGQRFLMNTVVQDPAGTPLRVIVNWHPQR